MPTVPSRWPRAVDVDALAEGRRRVEKTSVGAPPVPTVLPLITTAPLAPMVPIAFATPGTAWTWASTDWGSAPVAEKTLLPPKAALRVMLTSVPFAAFSKMS